MRAFSKFYESVCRRARLPGTSGHTNFRSDESGSILIFCIFLLVLLLFIGGMAVDIMRFETRRVAMQNTLDTAVLAASSLTQNMNAETLVKEYVAKAGFDPDLVTVKSSQSVVNDSKVATRKVQASANVSSDNLFMDMMGIPSLNGTSGGTAEEGIQNIEISLILDISGSMGQNSKIDNLKAAAKQFIDVVLTNNPRAGMTSISIVPYNGVVVVGEDLLSRLNASGTTLTVANPSLYPGVIKTYATEHSDSSCIHFKDDDFKSRAVSSTTPLNRVAHFMEASNRFGAPSMGQRWCDTTRAAILPMSDNADLLKAYIQALQPGGYTGIDVGLKWGAALLDPAIAPVIKDMANAGLISTSMIGRPRAYDPTETIKVAVLMTDGANTIEEDLKPEFKTGPSRVWYAKTRTSGYDALLGRNLTEDDGYYVEMPNNDLTKRWYVPASPKSSKDDTYVASALLPMDAVQLDHLELNRRFSAADIATFFFRYSDDTTYRAYKDAVVQHDTYGQLDDRLKTMCSAAKANGDITIYAIGFEAPDEGQAAMLNCATSPSYYYDVAGTQISDAFASIAGQITKLRLTQ